MFVAFVLRTPCGCRTCLLLGDLRADWLLGVCFPAAAAAAPAAPAAAVAAAAAAAAAAGAAGESF